MSDDQKISEVIEWSGKTVNRDRVSDGGCGEHLTQQAALHACSVQICKSSPSKHNYPGYI